MTNYNKESHLENLVFIGFAFKTQRRARATFTHRSWTEDESTLACNSRRGKREVSMALVRQALEGLPDDDVEHEPMILDCRG